MATKKELRYEAAAWRKIACEIAVRGAPNGVTFGYLFRADMPAMAMGARHSAHNTVSQWMIPDEANERVLAALFLALECEDEANALKSSPSKAGGRTNG